MMDENFKDSLNIYAAACLTFGYDDDIGSYSDVLEEAGFSNFSSMIFGKEYSLLKSGKKNAIIGLRAIKFDSVFSNATKKNYLNRLFSKIAKKHICDYANLFLKKCGFGNINTKSISFEYSKILKLLGVTPPKFKPSIESNIEPKLGKFEKLTEKLHLGLDDIDIRKINRDSKNKEKKEMDIKKHFSPELLKKVDLDKILSCNNICVQNMDSLNSEFEPLKSKELEELRRLCHIYTGDKYVFLNGVLRGRVRPLYDGSNLEKMIKVYNKKLNETMKYIEVYEPKEGHWHDLYVLPLDMYKEIKDTCHSLANALREGKKSGNFWRVMGVRALKSMLGAKSENVTMKDEDIKKSLKNNDKSFINQMNDDLRGKVMWDNAFLSTSFADGVCFEPRGAIILKIEGKNLPGLMVDDFSFYESENEFLVPPKTKFKIVSVSEYDGANKSTYVKECIQINCVNV